VEAWFSLTPVSDIYALNPSASPLAGSQTTFLLGGGFFVGGFPLVSEVMNSVSGPGVYLQVRAWDNAGGQYTTWEQAWNAALAGSDTAVGWSEVFWQPVNSGLGEPASLDNFESFNIFIVPEPSTVALFGLGGLSLWLFRRRK
jgi:hypothetical protein